MGMKEGTTIHGQPYVYPTNTLASAQTTEFFVNLITAQHSDNPLDNTEWRRLYTPFNIDPTIFDNLANLITQIELDIAMKDIRHTDPVTG